MRYTIAPKLCKLAVSGGARCWFPVRALAANVKWKVLCIGKVQGRRQCHQNKNANQEIGVPGHAAQPYPEISIRQDLMLVTC
jgi:hypothetical protein